VVAGWGVRSENFHGPESMYVYMHATQCHLCRIQLLCTPILAKLHASAAKREGLDQDLI
jgi:hypothetical protein